MNPYLSKTALALLLGLSVGLTTGVPVAAETPQNGGTLNFVVAGEAPSKDGHGESTYAVIHPYAPFYSLLSGLTPTIPSHRISSVIYV